MYYTYLPYIEYSKLKNLDAAYRDIECFKITLTKKICMFFHKYLLPNQSINWFGIGSIPKAEQWCSKSTYINVTQYAVCVW